MFKNVLLLKMFRQQKGLVDPMEVPLSVGLSWVMRLKTDIYKKIEKTPILLVEAIVIACERGL